ncbi:hypothetical protein BC941DRAFT_486844, partial [Chlamydoabsidia padenii]
TPYFVSTSHESASFSKTSSKYILQEKDVVNIIVENLIGLEGRDHYNPWPPQWPNGKISDIVYMPAYDAPRKYPPIIVEIQHTVDVAFMFRLMSYCQQLFRQQKIVPVVLIFVVSQIKHEVAVNCKTSSKHAFCSLLWTTAGFITQRS